MREKFAIRSLEYITTFYSYDNQHLEKLKYGLEAFYSFATKTGAIILFSIILGTFKETMLLIFFYTLLRSFAFGIHASSNLACWLITIPVFGIAPFIAKILIIPDYMKIFIIFIGILTFLFYAPADTYKRPLVNSIKRMRGKLLSLIAILPLQAIILFSSNQIIANLALFAIIFQIICIIPITYKIFKMPYNNYQTYKKV